MRNKSQFRHVRALLPTTIPLLDRWRLSQSTLGFTEEELELHFHFVESFASPLCPPLVTPYMRMRNRIEAINLARGLSGDDALRPCSLDTFASRALSLPYSVIKDTRGAPQVGRRRRKLLVGGEHDEFVLDRAEMFAWRPGDRFQSVNSMIKTLDFIEDRW